MPFRLDEFRAKIQFTTSAEMPSLIYRACLATGTVSNTVYCQHALAEALARDLDVPIEDILANLPAPRGVTAHVFNPEDGKQSRYGKPAVAIGHRIGPAGTIEDVR